MEILKRRLGVAPSSAINGTPLLHRGGGPSATTSTPAPALSTAYGGAGALVRGHWARFGRTYSARRDYEGLDAASAETLAADLRAGP